MVHDGDTLGKLIENSKRAIGDGTYDVDGYNLQRSGKDLSLEIKRLSTTTTAAAAKAKGADADPDDCHTARKAAIISEIKFSSPSEGSIRAVSNPGEIAASMVRGGAIGLSVLTQPYMFGGSPEYFAVVRQRVDVPMLMKDIIIDKRQIDAAVRIGADCILLIQSAFESGLLADRTPDQFISYAHKKGLGVLLEVHTTQEYRNARHTKADIIGINNRNLGTLEVNTDTTCAILAECSKDDSRPVISESGIKSPEDVARMRRCGADALLVGSSIMKSKNIETALRELTGA